MKLKRFLIPVSMTLVLLMQFLPVTGFTSPVGAAAPNPSSAKLTVATDTTAYDFVANYCSATWTSGAGALLCPGTDGAASGYVLKVTSPTLENGTIDTAPGLVVAPQNVAGGYIQAVYPAFTVQAGDRFQSIVNCTHGATNCYVLFRLDYKIGSGPQQTFWHFKERYDGLFFTANLDLSSLAGQSVQFILYMADVSGLGTPSGDRAMWGGAKIVRSSGTPVPTPVPSTGDRGSFIADVTIPDGTVLTAGTPFVKTFRIKNVGSTTWTTAYSMVFVAGDLLGASPVINLTSNVAPGQTMDFSINMVAPLTGGHYRSYWRFKNASGVQFGLGSGMVTFFADINVAGASGSAYDFAANACSATWSSAAGVLPCPGTDGDTRGFVLKLASPQLEDGSTGPAGLLTFPQYVNNGYIQGVYPAITVQSGDHFQSIINCQFGATGCYVTFQLNYRIGAGPVQTLKNFSEKIDGMYYNLDVDLSSLAGQNVNFILTVWSAGSPAGDRAVWSGPHIARSGAVVPTPTPVPTSPSPTATAVISGPNTDLGVTVNDSVLFYTPGSSVTYKMRVTNYGPQAVTAATFNANRPTNITSWTVSCVATSGASCTAGPVSPVNITDSVNIPVGGYVEYTVVANVSASATGSLITTATITNPLAVPDPNLANNSTTDTDAPPSADLAVSINDSITTYTAGGVVSYSISVVNNGPLAVTGATFNDALPTQITSWTWACTPSSGSTWTGPASSTTNYASTVGLPVGGRVDCVVNASISIAATNDLVNTVSITNPVGTPDPIPANNTASHTDSGPSAELNVTVDDGVSFYSPGGTLTYTIVARNNGPTATNAIFTDNIPAQISQWTWTCLTDVESTCLVGSSTIATNFTDTVHIPSGHFVTYTVVATVNPAATGNLVNTATIQSNPPIPDPNPANNSGSDTDSAPSADLSVTITDGLSIYPPAGTVTYTIKVTNNGPSDVTNAVFTDNIPGQLTSWIWTCAPLDSTVTCTSPGVPMGAFVDPAVTIPAHKYLTYTVVASVAAGASGDMINTPSITAPAGVTDPLLTNNSATDTDVHPTADLMITNNDQVTNYTAGGSVIYTIRITNLGPSKVINATFTDAMPGQITNWTWSCVPTLGASCTSPGVLWGGMTDNTVTIPAGGYVEYTAVATIGAGALGPMTNTAVITSPAAPPENVVPDPNLTNNTAIDVDTP